LLPRNFFAIPGAFRFWKRAKDKFVQSRAKKPESKAQYENHDPASIAGTPQHSILCRKKEFQILRNFASRFP